MNEKETLDINISPDNLKAFIRFYQPIGDGEKVGLEDIILAAREKGITFGVEVQNLIQILEDKKYNQDYKLATGLSPKVGENGEVVYLFEMNKDTGRFHE